MGSGRLAPACWCGWQCPRQRRVLPQKPFHIAAQSGQCVGATWPWTVWGYFQSLLPPAQIFLCYSGVPVRRRTHGTVGPETSHNLPWIVVLVPSSIGPGPTLHVAVRSLGRKILGAWGGRTSLWDNLVRVSPRCGPGGGLVRRKLGVIYCSPCSSGQNILVAQFNCAHLGRCWWTVEGLIVCWYCPMLLPPGWSIGMLEVVDPIPLYLGFPFSAPQQLGGGIPHFEAALQLFSGILWSPSDIVARQW